MRRLLCIFVCLHTAYAGNWYVRPTTQGNGDGTSWSNAWSVSNLNGSWNKVGAGDTVWLAGGTYTTSVKPTKSGTSGNPIKIYRVRSTDAAASVAGWQPGFDAQVFFNKAGFSWENSGAGNWVEIDGRIDRGIRSYVSNNGWADANISFSSSNHNNIVVRNVDFAGPMPEGGSMVDQKGDGGNFLLTAATGGSVTGVTFEGCRFHGHVNAFYSQTGNDGFTFINCKVYDCGSSGSIHSNIMWMAGGCDRWQFINCEFWNWQVEGFSLDAANDWAWVGCLVRDPINSGARFLWLLTAGGSGQGQTPQGPFVLYNNTFVNVNVTVDEDRASKFDSASVSKNNIFWNARFGNWSPAPTNSNYNFSNGSAPGGGANSISNGSNPFVNMSAKDFNLTANAQPRDKGTALPAPYNAAPYNVDASGRTRGADGKWDIGAFEYGGSAPVPTPTATPVPTATPTPAPTATPTPKFAVGDRVETIYPTNVRETGALNGVLIGENPVGTLGTLLEGPSASPTDPHLWWRVDYDVGYDGWSGEENFKLSDVPAPTPTPTPTPEPTPVPTPTPPAPDHVHTIDEIQDLRGELDNLDKRIDNLEGRSRR